MLTIRAGHMVRYYTDATVEGRENYYTGAVTAGEPPGRWQGSGAESLGLTGLVRAQDMIGLYERFLDPRDPLFSDESRWDEVSNLGHGGRRYLSEDQIYAQLLDANPGADATRRDELRVEAGQRVRHNVSYLDVTTSVPKSMTVAHAAFEHEQIAAQRAGDTERGEAWGVLKKAVEDAIWAGNNAALRYLATHAGYSRIGHHGGAGGRWIDAHDWTVASFFQHDSRDHDPQLHIHNAVLNRVECSDGQWRTLDSRGVHAFKPAASAVQERVTEAHLAQSLGALSATRPDGKARELLGVDQAVCELLSSRRRSIGTKAAELVAAFEQRHGREPTALERDRLARQANLATRRSKTQGETVEQRLDRVETQVADELGGGLGKVAEDILAMARSPRPAAERWSAREVLETALAAVQDKQSAWSPPDLTREISDALPDYLGTSDPDEIAELLDELTRQGVELAITLEKAKPGDAVLARQFQLADGSSAFVAPGRARYATPDHLHTERLLVAAASVRDARAASTSAAADSMARLKESGIELGADQAAVVSGVLTSGARLESMIGPAGAGKSFVLGALARAWADPRTWNSEHSAGHNGTGSGVGRVVGLATSQRAAEVLNAEGLAAANTAAWLAAQGRIAQGRANDADQQWILDPGDLVVIDESSMADTASVAAVYEWVRAVGAKLLLVGDHRQLGAVGAGGIAELLAERGPSYELTEVRRFQQGWERTASLRLRAGDMKALDAYHREGRILDGGTLLQAETAAATGWLADTLRGKQSVLVVDTNEQTARLNATLRAQLVELGRVSENGVVLGRDGTAAGVGDVVQARRLAWELTGYAGNPRGPITREQYRVEEIREDGSIVVTPLATRGDDGRPVERLALPASYVAEDLTLAYAVTVHAVEGLTVDTGHTVTTPRTSANSLYPSVTRGGEANHLYVVTRDVAEDATPGEVARALTRNPRSVLAGILETSQVEQSATAVAAESAEIAASARTAAERLAAVAEVAVAERTTRWLDELTGTGELAIVERRRLAAEDGVAKLAPILRRIELAGQDPRAALAEEIRRRSLAGAQQISNVLVHRLTEHHQLDPIGSSFAEWAPATDDPGMTAQLAAIAEHGDLRRLALGEQLADQPPAWATAAFGAVPHNPIGRDEWIAKVRVVAAHREMVEHTDPADALGPVPKAGQIEAYASWRAAARALGHDDDRTAEQGMSDGQLRMRVRAWEREQPWAPRRVADELAGTIQAEQRHRHDAQLATARANATDDPARREELTQEARDYTALADLLEQRIPVLRGLDDNYYDWYLHTLETRHTAERAQVELANRGVLHAPEHEQITVAEWSAAKAAADLAEDPHREITEHDLIDLHHDAGHELVSRHQAAPGLDDSEAVDRGEIERAKHLVQPEDTLDLREIAAGEPAQTDENLVRVPSADQTTDAVDRAARALVELRFRIAADNARGAEEERYAQLARWHDDDRAADHGLSAEHDDSIALDY